MAMKNMEEHGAKVEIFGETVDEAGQVDGSLLSYVLIGIDFELR